MKDRLMDRVLASFVVSEEGDEAARALNGEPPHVPGMCVYRLTQKSGEVFIVRMVQAKPLFIH